MKQAWSWFLLLLPCAALAAPGSWSGTLVGPRVAGPGRSYLSRALVPPDLATQAHVWRVRWQYHAPVDRLLDAELCTAGICVALSGRQGHGHLLRGLPADQPWHFRFRLPGATRTPVKIGRIQLIVDYR